MDSPAHQLWRINSEYQKRLQQARTYLTLLEDLALICGADAQALNTLHHVRVQIDALADEHRHWRYQYYYDSPDTRRMIQTLQRHRPGPRQLQRYAPASRPHPG